MVRARKSTSSQPSSSSAPPSSSFEIQPSSEPLSHERKMQLSTNRKNLKDRKTIDGRPVDSSIGYDTASTFQLLGWAVFLSISFTLCPSHLIEFFAGYSFDSENDLLLFDMYNKSYQLTLSNFAQILDVPCSGTRVYSNSHSLDDLPVAINRADIISSICLPSVSPDTTLVLVNDLLPECKIWKVILDNNVYARHGNRSAVMAVEAYFLFCLKTNTTVNIAYFMAKRMEGIPSSNQKLIPYARLLTKLFNQIPSLPEKPHKSSTTQPIDYRTVQNVLPSSSTQTSKRRRSFASTSQAPPRDEIDELVDSYDDEIRWRDVMESEVREVHSKVGKLDEKFDVLQTDFTEFKTDVKKELSGFKKILHDILGFIKKGSCSSPDKDIA